VLERAAGEDRLQLREYFIVARLPAVIAVVLICHP
jgi:hypothetical protein